MPKPRILLVDDDRDFLLAMRVRLEASGYEVIGTSDVIGALAAVENQPPPDLILLDIGLGVGNGIMLLDCFRTMDALKRTPVVILTALPVPFLRDEARKRGVAAFFQKPADNAELLAAIRQALGENRS
jgi:CheY-like chemotaxis protein